MSKPNNDSLHSWLEDLARDSSCFQTKRNKIRLFFEGDATFESMLEDIAGAERFVHLEMYQFLSDETGRWVAEALMRKASAGIPVCLVYDGVGSLEAEEEMFQEMEKSGVRVEVFRPVAPWRKRSGIFGRNHRKNLIVDGRVAYTGGMNLGNHWSRKRCGSAAWRDTHMRIEGPGAAACEEIFKEAWTKAGGKEPREKSFYQLDEDGPGEADCLVVGGSGFSKRKTIRRLYSGAFSHSRERIDLTVPYFVPPKRLLDAMADAEARGVEIEVLVPGESDVALADFLRGCLYPSLMRDGLVFHEYQRSILHAKSMLVDDRLAVVGSANLDLLSISWNWEMAVIIADEEAVGELRQQHVRDLEGSRKVLPEMTNSRSWWRKFVGWFGGMLIRKL